MSVRVINHKHTLTLYRSGAKYKSIFSVHGEKYTSSKILVLQNTYGALYTFHIRPGL